MRHRITTSLIARGLPTARTQAEAAVRQSRGGGSGSGSRSTAAIPQFYRLDFAYATRTVLYVMAGIMAVAWLVAMIGLRRGLQEETPALTADGVAAGEPVEVADPARWAGSARSARSARSAGPADPRSGSERPT